MEKLFKKVKNENISFGNHKSELRDLLLSRNYFSQKSDYWDWKLVFSSLSFSCLLIAFIFISPASSGNMVSGLDKNINVNDKQKRKYMISKSKIRSIHSSLAIEANSLSLFDVESSSLGNDLIHIDQRHRLEKNSRLYLLVPSLRLILIIL